jgi:zinc protease
VDEVFSQNHFRRRPWSPALVQEMNLDAALAFYKDRFQDAGDFTFLFVGSFTPEALEPLVASYLGTLPSTGRAESWKDVGIRPPAGVVQDTVRKGLEPKSRVEILFHGGYPWSLENNLQFDALGRVLDIELREAVRDRAGGSYDVGSGAQISHFPTEQFLLYISFGCAPDKVQPLSEIALDQVRKLQAQGPKAEDVAKVREELLRQNQTDVKTNEYWLQDLQLLSMNGADLRAGLQFEQWVNGLSVESLRKLASSALSLDNYVRVVLLPEK